MARVKVLGYSLTLKWGTKLISGLETTGLKLKPNFETLLLKENEGEAQEELVDFDTNLTFSGKTFLNESGDGTTHEDFVTLRSAAAAGAEVAFVYGRFTVGKKTVAGTGVLVDFSEDANSKDIGTFSGSIEAKKGTVTFPAYTAP
jgi:hypothetical protein